MHGRNSAGTHEADIEQRKFAMGMLLCLIASIQRRIHGILLAHMTLLLLLTCSRAAASKLFLIAEESAVPSLSPIPSLNPSEVSALLILRGQLGIRSRYWPRKADPCLSWTGVQCQDGHVVSISLSLLRRTAAAELHPSFVLDPLRNLSRLAVFNSSGFTLQGSIPEWFGSLYTLTQLDFTSSSISSSLPSSLGNLISLETLSMAENNLTGSIPASFGNLSSLTSLDLSSNLLTGTIPQGLSNLHSLRTLNLGTNQLTGRLPPSIGSLIKLQFLLLGGNDLHGSTPVEVGNLSSLISLDMGFNSLSGPIPTTFGGLTSLVSLNLSNNALSGTIPAELSKCSRLQSLSMDRNALTGSLPSSLGYLRNLSTLSLFSNHLTGVLPTDIAQLLQIRYILLSNNLFYGPIPSLVANLTHIFTLDLSMNYFEGHLPAPFVPGALLDGNCLANEPNQRTVLKCSEFYSSRGLLFQGTAEYPSPRMPLAGVDVVKKSNRLVPILGATSASLAFALLVLAVLFIVLKRQKNSEIEQGKMFGAVKKGVPAGFTGKISVNLLCLGESFAYEELERATESFSESSLLKLGHSGEFYQGLLEGHIPIVVKRVDHSRFKKECFMSELDLFGKASHTRLVPFLGHCLEREEETLLVYKYMPGRDLGYALQRRSKENPPEDSLQSLDWITRLKIALGVAEGLTHLHYECTPPLVHRDIKSTSILLDDKFEVRLGSLAEACVATGEAHHGVIARLLRRSQTSKQGGEGLPGLGGGIAPTCAYDVYCFGKVLLELVSGKVGLSSCSDPSMDAWLDWALTFINVHDKESICKIVDPSLIVDEDLMEEVWAMSIVAKSCLNPKPSKRPLMRYVLKALENPLKVVREDALNMSAKSRTSSYGSWNGAFFGSCHNSSDGFVIPGSLREEYLHKSKRAAIGSSKGSGRGQGEASRRRSGSSEIFPEPLEDNTIVVQAPTNRGV